MGWQRCARAFLKHSPTAPAGAPKGQEQQTPIATRPRTSLRGKGGRARKGEVPELKTKRRALHSPSAGDNQRDPHLPEPVAAAVKANSPKRLPAYSRTRHGRLVNALIAHPRCCLYFASPLSFFIGRRRQTRTKAAKSGSPACRQGTQRADVDATEDQTLLGKTAATRGFEGRQSGNVWPVSEGK